jgi:hypothetical protein
LGSFDQGLDKQYQHQQQQQQRGGMMQHSQPNQPPTSSAGPIMMNSAQPPLNHILGGLHKERLSRLSMNRPLSRGDSSLHSMGSVGGHSAGGNSYRSLPGNLQQHAMNNNVGMGNNTLSWNMNHYQQQQHQQRPPSFVQQQQRQQQTPLSMMDEDAEMEEADNDTTSKMLATSGSFNSASGHAAAATGGGSVASGSLGNLSRTSSGNINVSTGSGIVEDGNKSSSSIRNESDSKNAAVPKWKRRVNLPSHSSLY